MKSQLLLISLLTGIALSQGQGSSVSSGTVQPSPSSNPSSSNGYSSEYGVIEFDNLGFEGYFRHVKSLDDSDSCKCELASNSQRTIFSGANSPINEEVSVHFRGPMILSKFAFYTTDYYSKSNTSTSSWSRDAFYDGGSQTSNNVTFLTAAGTNSTCLGKALTYAGSDGISAADNSTILANNTLIASDDEFIIFSTAECEKSGFNKDCGVYRDGIPAYKGFSGTTKMFLFEFEAPEETSANEDSFEYYNLPAIWLLNAHIPRTSQYPTNENCSCWATGCGEFDIFEVMNTTQSNHFFTTLHDYQGSDDIGTGIAAPGYTLRTPNAVMKGGVVFGTDGNVIVFLSNDTSIDESISFSNLNSWISTATSDDGVVTDTLASATNTGSGKVSGAAGVSFNLDVRFIFAAFALVGSLVLF